jgi:hypothetical protein
VTDIPLPPKGSTDWIGWGGEQEELSDAARELDASFVTVTEYGAVGDGIADDTGAIQAAINSASALHFPAGTYRTTGTLTLRSESSYMFAGRGAVIRYEGTGAAVDIPNRKRIQWSGGRIELVMPAGATSSTAIGLRIRGLWFGTFTDLSIKQVAGTTGVHIETSATAGNDWGAYLLRFVNIDMQEGSGAYGFRTLRTVAGLTSDTVNVTHLDIFGGWVHSRATGMDLRNVHSGRVFGTAIEGASGDGIFLQDCSDVVLQPGEVSGAGGWAINPGTGNAALFVFAPSTVGTGTLGYLNRANHRPTELAQGRAVVRASRTDETYWAELRANFDYGRSAQIVVRGGGPEDVILEYGDAAGTTIRGSATSGGQLNLPVKLAHAGASAGFFGVAPVARPAALTAADAAVVDGTYGAEEAGVIANLRTRVNELEARLRSLGLIT